MMKVSSILVRNALHFVRMSYQIHESPSVAAQPLAAYNNNNNNNKITNVVCVHGLTRNGRDFDVLAKALIAADQPARRVICPDIVGRGKSDWLPSSNIDDYNNFAYSFHVASLISKYTADADEKIDYIGTSMGGIIGMILASMPNSPIRRLVLNDIGAVVAREALERIAGYIGNDPTFESLQDLENYLRTIHKPFGPLTDEQWRSMALSSARQESTGSDGKAVYKLAFDPNIAVAFQKGFLSQTGDVSLWPLWDAIKCPVLIIRGKESDILPASVVGEMQRRGPASVTVAEFDGVGHAPALMADDQVAAILRWFETTPY